MQSSHIHLIHCIFSSPVSSNIEQSSSYGRKQSPPRQRRGTHEPQPCYGGSAFTASSDHQRRYYSGSTQGFLSLLTYLRIVDEIALYDRQIRLWGVRAQEKYYPPCPAVTKAWD